MKTWVRQLEAGDQRGAVSDLIAIYKHQVGALLQARESDEVVVELAPCGSGGRLEHQGMTYKHPQRYAGWSDGVSSYCQLCKTCQDSLNDAVGYPMWTTKKQTEDHCTMRFRKRAVDGKRLFGRGDLEQTLRTRTQLIAQKLEAGDADVEPLLRSQRKDWMPWHDSGVVCLAYFYNMAIEKSAARSTWTRC